MNSRKKFAPIRAEQRLATTRTGLTTRCAYNLADVGKLHRSTRYNLKDRRDYLPEQIAFGNEICVAHATIESNIHNLRHDRSTRLIDDRYIDVLGNGRENWQSDSVHPFYNR